MRSEAACPICRAPAKEFSREYAYHLTFDEKAEMLSMFLFVGINSCVGRLMDYYLF